MRLKSKFLLAIIMASATFALMTLFIAMLNCKFGAGVCYTNIAAITFNAARFISLALFFFGLGMNSIFFIGSLIYKQSNLKHQCMRYFLAGIGPIVIFFLNYLLSNGMLPVVTSGLIWNCMELTISGLVSGFVFNLNNLK